MADRGIYVLLAGGGTGGHLFTAIAIADELRKLRPGVKILFVGTKRKIEAKIVPEKGYRISTIWISALHRDFRPSNLLFPLKVGVALLQSFSIIRKFSPDVAIGTGGYVAGPVLWVASMLGIPIVVHESNSYPGITTRLLSRRASKVFITFEATRKWLRGTENVELVGNPTRDILGRVSREEGARFFNISSKKKTLLVFGGSQGASSLNMAIAGVAPDLIEAGIQLIWQAGEQDFPKVSSMQIASADRPSELQSLWIGNFIDRMEYAYAAADLVMCRSGATTLAEITRLGKPAILVPYPHAAADHQVVNARTLVEQGAAEMIIDDDLGTRAKETIVRLISDSEKLKGMGERALKLGKPEAGRKIAEKILTLLSR